MLKRQLLSRLLAGRDAELEALTERLEAACDGHGGTALIGGDAGMGKSRLCRELKQRAAARDVRVIEGRCSPAESGVPYGPFIDALRFRIARGEGEEAAQVLAPILAHVAPLFSELSAIAGGGQEPSGVHAPFEPIFEVIRRLARLGPSLFLIEDVHWADATSRDLVHYMARHLAGEPVLLVVTYRTDELHIGHPVHRLVSSLVRERLALSIQLEPLALPAVEAMLTSMLERAPSADLVRAVRDRSDGNPLFIEELMSALAEQRPDSTDYDAAALVEAAPPATIHDIMAARLDPLGDDAAEAMAVAAVIGRRFRFDVLARALDWPDDRLLALVERLLERGVLVEEEGGAGESYLFRHSLMQEVLYAGAIGRRRRVWHRRVAEAIERVGGQPGALLHTTLAHHYRAGGDPQRARVHAVLAGDEAVRLCAWTDAQRLYEQALAAVEQEDPDPALEATLLEKMAGVAWWQNRFDLLEQYATDALALRRSLGDRARQAALLRRLAELHAYQRSEPDRAIALLSEALALLDEDAGAALASVHNDLGRLHLARGALDDAELALDRALLAGRNAVPGEEALTVALLGQLAFRRGDAGAGAARLDLARALLCEQALPVERAAGAYHAAIHTLEAAREIETARGWVASAVDFAERHDAAADLAMFRVYGAACDRRVGRWDEALRAAAQAADVLRTAGRTELRDALRVLGDLRRVRGEADLARAHYEEARRMRSEDAPIGLALLCMQSGDYERAIEILEPVTSDRRDDALFAVRVLPILGEAQFRAGRTKEARATCTVIGDYARRTGLRSAGASHAFLDGLLAACGGEIERAAVAFRVAAREWEVLGLPYEAARARMELAAVLIGDEATRDEGATIASAQLAELERLGAEPVARRARTLLGEQRDESAAGPALFTDLTPREEEVLRELMKGSTNKQIARVLGIKPKTVSNHVTSILAKFGCSNRAEALRLALEAEFGRSDAA